MKATVTCLTTYRAERDHAATVAAPVTDAEAAAFRAEALAILSIELAEALGEPAPYGECVFSDGGSQRRMTVAQALREFECVRTTPVGGVLKPELQGMPVFRGWAGPIWGGAETPLRYESWERYNELST